MSNGNQIQAISFSELLNEAPSVKRGGGGKVSDPNSARFGRCWTEKSHTQTLTLPERFITELHYRTGIVTVSGGVITVIMSTQTKEQNGAKWMKFHQRLDTRHLVVPNGSAVGDYLHEKTSHRFKVREAEPAEVTKLPEHAKAYILEEVK